MGHRLGRRLHLRGRRRRGCRVLDEAQGRGGRAFGCHHAGARSCLGIRRLPEFARLSRVPRRGFSLNSSADRSPGRAADSSFVFSTEFICSPTFCPGLDRLLGSAQKKKKKKKKKNPSPLIPLL